MGKSISFEEGLIVLEVRNSTLEVLVLCQALMLTDPGSKLYQYLHCLICARRQ